MRQANFPDQKALTARDETNSEPSQEVGLVPSNSGYLLFSGPRRQRKQWAGSTVSPPPACSHVPATLITALVKQVEGRSAPAQSCQSPPYAKLPQR